jgi:hypothetical protein
VSASNARRLLDLATAEGDSLRRHLLVAAALREVLQREPVVVGGTAEEFHTAAVYHETDLDLVGWLTSDDRRAVRELGFRKRGRHWFHEASKVAVEFPESVLDGDEARVVRTHIHRGTAAVIGLDDLYLDRIRRATVSQSERTTEFRSALAVAATTFDRIDWRYVERRIRATVERDPRLGVAMRGVDRRVRWAVRNAAG